MDFLIVYERKNRELENALLLKLELERRGYKCEVCQYYEGSGFDVFELGRPKIVLVPHLYDTKSVIRNLSRFGAVSHLVNLQYEQVLSDKWERLGHHNPKGEAVKGIHVCWGEKTARRLIGAGVPEQNVKVLGALQLDLLRPEYRRAKSLIRDELCQKFDLDVTKRWTLFLSSFTYADIAEERLRMNEAVAKVSLESFVGLHTNSRNEILKWLESVLLKDLDNYIIYRPHPDELSLDKVLELERKYPNFRVINDRSAKIWIESSDNVYSWYSTTVVESHFLGRPYSILRPFELPDDFDSVLLKRASFVESYEGFEVDYFKDDSDRVFPIDENFITQYYKVDGHLPSFVAFCDFLEELSISGSVQTYDVGFRKGFLARCNSVAVFMAYSLSRVLCLDLERYRTRSCNNFVIRWFIEMENQIASRDERALIEKSLLSIIGGDESSSGEGAKIASELVVGD
jgi:surface carbohydrate biosynthesis protein